MTSTDIVYEVVAALAAAEGTDPGDLEYTLADYVDTDVLSMLGRSDGSIWDFKFHVKDHTVRLTHDGRIYIDGVAYRGGVRIEEPHHN
jgi:hypothetical protein